MLEPWAFQSKRWKKLPYLTMVDGPNLRQSQAVFVTCPMEANHVKVLTNCDNVKELPLGLSAKVTADREVARANFGLESSDRVLLYLSRIDPKKGLDRMLFALEGTPQQNWQVWVVGDGDPNWVNKLKQWSAARRRQLPTIHWVGAQWGEAKWPYLAAADLFCLPTHSENFGLAVLESLWVGTPVLTTPDTPWVDYAHVDGIQITRNDVNSLRGALHHQFKNYGWTASQRCQLKSWSQTHFHWNRLRGQYLKAYERLIGLEA